MWYQILPLLANRFVLIAIAAGGDWLVFVDCSFATEWALLFSLRFEELVSVQYDEKLVYLNFWIQRFKKSWTSIYELVNNWIHDLVVRWNYNYWICWSTSLLLWFCILIFLFLYFFLVKLMRFNCSNVIIKTVLPNWRKIHTQSEIMKYSPYIRTKITKNHRKEQSHHQKGDILPLLSRLDDRFQIKPWAYHGLAIFPACLQVYVVVVNHIRENWYKRMSLNFGNSRLPASSDAALFPRLDQCHY